MLSPRQGDVSDSVLENIISGIFSDDNQTRQQFLSIIGLLYQAGINIAVGVVSFLVFVFLRPRNSRIYARRYKALANDEQRRPPKIGRGLLAWVPILWRTDEQYLLDSVDVDSVLFLRFLKLNAWLMGIFGVVGMCLILPLNFSNGNNENVTANLKEFTLLWITLYHITKLSIFWLHLACAYLFTGVFAYFLWRECRRYIVIRQKHFASPAYLRKLQSRTIMVTRIPDSLQDNNALGRFIVNRGSAAPAQVSIARKIGELQEMIDSHERAVRKLEQVLHRFLAGNIQTKPRPLLKHEGVMVDAIEHYTTQIQGLEHTINMTRRETELFKPTSVGFISYDSPMMAHDAMRALKKLRPVVATLSPHPKDIIWSNAQMPHGKRLRRLWVARLMSIAFCFVAFWPVAALTFIGDSTNIRVLWPHTSSFFTNNSTLTTIWQNTFSPLVLTLYYITIPYVFRAISRYQGIATHTGVERSVLRKMYVFYFLSNIIVFTLIGLIVRAVFHKKAASEVVSSLPADFIQSINMKAQFWTAYVSLRGLNASFEFAQLISLFMIFFKRYTRHLTPRELRDVTKPPEFDYSPVYSLYLWIFTISMLYSVYAPIALPFAFIAFVLAYWVYKYAVMYVYKTSHDTAGSMWRHAINCMIASMVIFQVYLICCLKVRIDDFTDRPDEMRSSAPVVYTLIPLPLITAAAGIYLHFWLSRRVNYMNSGDAESFVVHKAANVNSGGVEETLGDRFLHPIFSQPLPTPMVDKRVRHLLPRVYRGRVSMHGGTVRHKGQPDMENKQFAPSIANASTVFGSEAMDLDSVMDERDRYDFDGAATPDPFQQQRKVGAVTMVGDRGPSQLARSYSVDSNMTNGDQMEMEAMGSGSKQSHSVRATGSRANLLTNAQPLSVHSPEYLDYDGNATMVGRSATGSPEHVPMNLQMNSQMNSQVRETFDPIDLYGDTESRGTSRADSRARQNAQQGVGDEFNEYIGSGPWYGDSYEPMPHQQPQPQQQQLQQQPSRYDAAPRQAAGVRLPQMHPDVSTGAFGSRAPPSNQQNQNQTQNQNQNNPSRNVPRWE
ncbi:hypothetical protein J3B01_002311 [Coemansia erecta]|nr:hypothetical protein J3B01_002311 [Coemansia erecta]